ncbi:hypothetical protein [Aequorivita marina]|uniref:hypothetical protein n=1 Tax=Aequorivita marina TaxID=3073654 RepID=UPI0028759BFC|nr:hypothetical protein [Aequorivita sp. S2608]MDS1297887.1 hypothetical protein [Aequorivita sp. S2608]
MSQKKYTDYVKPINTVEVAYAQTGNSKRTNEMGMREMQTKAYEARTAQYLLLKAPSASGKSRALMFIALDKLYHQGIKKAIVAVPERGSGFCHFQLLLKCKTKYSPSCSAASRLNY